MADMKTFWIGMAVGGVVGFFVFSAVGREAIGTAKRVGASKARRGLKKLEKRYG